MVPMNPVILFDGVCNFCNGSVNFIIKRDPGGTFRFAAVQSDAGKALIADCGIDPAGIDSVILVDHGKAFTESAASLRISRRLGAPWSWAYALILVPRPIRDSIYGLIARNRYRLFGKRDECMIPTPDVRARFLD